MELKLKVLDGKHAGEEVPVSGNKFFIGRAEDCHLRPGSDLISRHHCVLVADEGYVGVRDLGSKNGTHVNAEPVIGERQLHNGDRLKIGPLEFEVVLSTCVGGKKKPAVTGGIKEAATRAASATATASDIDVSAWLAPELGQPSQPAPHIEPYTAATHDTDEIDTGATKDLVLEDAPGQKQQESSKSSVIIDPKAKKTPGKLPFTPQRITAKDSRDAAAQVLDMMRKRR
jgi:predicted component of type VI protein secretion system